MAIAYNWQITQTDYLVADGFITTAHWTATAVDGVYSASAYSTCGFAAATPAIPYASVTESEVLTWCWANGVDKTATEAAVEQQIQNQINPPVVTPALPWIS